MSFFPMNICKYYHLFIEINVGAIEEKKLLNFLLDLNLGSSIPESIHNKLLNLLKEYFIVGGMPEVVDVYRQHREQRLGAFKKVRDVQQDLLNAYVRNFSKYADNVRADRILAVFSSLPSQLVKENKKFVASKVLSGGRYSNLQSAVDWLEGAGLVVKVPIANSGELPFSAFTQESRFKLYFFDTGLLGALAQLSPNALYTEADLFATFKGAFCENYVAQEFRCTDPRTLYSWMNNTSEIEFMREMDGNVLPIEVKSGKSGKLKSLNVFAEKYAAAYRTRISARNLEINTEAAMHSYPLYLSGFFPLSQAD